MVTKRVPLFGDDKATEMLAKALVQLSMRAPLECFHGGEDPRSEIGDYSDVKVVTPYGEIAWADARRISQDEMRMLMMDVVSTLYTLLVGLDDVSMRASICLAAQEAIVKWSDPAVREGFRTELLAIGGAANEDLRKEVLDAIYQSEADRRSKRKEK